ncbi:MAG: hypothetical protein JSV56_02215, partial [Methanomassiliicoccales archaeon]
RVLIQGEEEITVFVAEDDKQKMEPGERIRLKDLCNVKILSENEAEFIGDDLSILKEGVKIIHWVGEDSKPTKLYMPDGTIKEGLTEHISQEDTGRVVQFERLGFARVEEKKEGYSAYFAHR